MNAISRSVSELSDSERSVSSWTKIIRGGIATSIRDGPFQPSSARVTAITDEQTISGETSRSEVFPHETKAIKTRTEVRRANRPDPD
jgi:hypothetical protein